MITFDVNPRRVLSRFPPQLITTIEEKVAILEMIGLDHLFILSFSEVMSLTPADFLEMLLRYIPIKLFVVGDDFRFGKKRQGDILFLREWCAARRIAVKAIDARYRETMRISSSVIRKLIFTGELEEAERVLAAPYALCGVAKVVATNVADFSGIVATIPSPRKIIPPNGVYVALLKQEDVVQRSLVHLGTHSDGSRLIEVFLYGREGLPVDGKFVSLFLFRRIRDEVVVGRGDALIARIEEDIGFSEYFWRHKEIPPLPRIRLLDGDITGMKAV